MTILRRLAVPIVGVIIIGGFVIGVWMGLVRIGWPFGSPPSLVLHAPLLVLGVLGALIGAERAVALGKAWAWIGPIASALGVVAMLAGAVRGVNALIFLIAGGGLVAVFVSIYRTHPAPHVVVMGAGAVAYVAAAYAWGVRIPVPAIVPLLAAFLVITIAGERLELARFGVGTAGVVWFVVAVVAVGLGAVVTAFGSVIGPRVAGVGLVAVALWLGHYDVARRTIERPDPTRFIAAALLAGYAWIAFAGVVWAGVGLQFGQRGYDAAVHAVFVGFVMSMIFGHAMIVLPSLSGLAFPWNPVLWVPLALLHLSLVARVVGDLTYAFDLRRWGGIVNAAALALFAAIAVVTVAVAAVRSRSAATT